MLTRWHGVWARGWCCSLCLSGLSFYPSCPGVPLYYLDLLLHRVLRLPGIPPNWSQDLLPPSPLGSSQSAPLQLLGVSPHGDAPNSWAPRKGERCMARPAGSEMWSEAVVLQLEASASASFTGRASVKKDNAPDQVKVYFATLSKPANVSGPPLYAAASPSVPSFHPHNSRHAGGPARGGRSRSSS